MTTDLNPFERKRSARLATALALFCGLALVAANAQAEKVGVAAAVNPDAFSSLAGKPQAQLNIGKSIFYNERINTTGSGLVQVLLIDGSTFTVGPGSDLVIDKFVYNPKKGTGELSASFSKGVMRFVGGKLSKNEGGVTVDTPTGALAIRGGIAYLQYSSPKNYAYLFVYGHSIQMNGQVIYEPGTGFINGAIKPFNAALINSMMASLTNSNTGGVGGDSPDPPQPSEFVNTQSLNQLISDATATQIQSEVQNQLNNQQPSPQPETVVVPDQLTLRVLSSPDYYLANQRTIFGHSFGGTFIADPGAHGILGGDDLLIPCAFAPAVCGPNQYFFKVNTDDFDMEWTSVAGGRATGTVPSLIARTGFLTYANTDEGPFDFPVFNVVGVHAVTNATMIGPDGEIVTLVGSAFTGKGGGFFAYQLFELGADGVADPNRPVLAFGGTPFQKPEGEANQVRLFGLFTDPRQGIPIPFAAAETAPTNLAGATIQPLYLLEGGEDGRSVWLQTSFLIQGQGPNQQTILVLALGEQGENGQLEGFRRGMSHVPVTINSPDGTQSFTFMQSYNLSGKISTLAGADGETHLFGTTLPHFVIGADSTGQGHNIFQDQALYPTAFSADGPPIASFTNALFDGPNHNSYGPPPASLGATYHIGEQVAQTAVPTPVTTDQDVDVYGYASGIYQQTTGSLNSDEPPVGMLLNSDPTDVHLKFKTDNRLSALFSLHGENGVDDGGANFAFGDWGNAHGHSAVINGNIYAAVESGTVPSTVLVEGYGGYDFPRNADTSLYLVSGALLNPNVAPCSQCDFIKWGTWGGQVQFKEGFGWYQQDITAHVNLGWYVAGDLTDVDTLAALGGGATYTGSVIGNVASLGETGWNTYVATGNLNMNWNFASRSGDLTISNFDNRSYSTNPGNQPGGLTQPVDINKFSGTLHQVGGPSLVNMTGGATGSFVNNGPANPAAGVIGNWNVHSDAYGATGVFAGRR
jgi:hypothetical protein